MNYLIISFDFIEKNIPLQPWKYIFELAKYLSQNGKVTILTNGSAMDKKIENIPIVHVDSISPKDTTLLLQKIISIKPDEIFWWASSRTYFYNNLFKKLDCKINLLYSGSVYYNSEILSVIGRIGKSNVKTYLPELLTPHFLTQKLINAKYINKAVTLSNRNRERFELMGCEKEKIVVTGIGKEIAGFEEELLTEVRNPKQLLYITSATKIRGIELLLNVFSLLVKKDTALRLRILARPSSGNASDLVRQLTKKLNIEQNVDLVEGWLTKKEILQELARCRALVMPFLLVHSEMPISIFEAFSVGTPVVAPDLDGITELVQERGIVYKHYSEKALERALKSVLDSEKMYNSYTKNALDYWQKRPLWKELFKNIDF